MAPLPPHSDPLERARAALQALRAADDWNEPTPVVHVNVHQAAAARRSSPPPPPPAPPRSLAAPRSDGVVVLVLRIVGQGVQRMPPVGLVLIFALLILVWAYLAVHGKAPVP